MDAAESRQTAKLIMPVAVLWQEECDGDHSLAAAPLPPHDNTSTATVHSGHTLITVSRSCQATPVQSQPANQKNQSSGKYFSQLFCCGLGRVCL